MTGDRLRLRASLGLMLGGALWGLFWLPVRGMSEMGLPGAWPGVALYGGGLLALLPLALLRRRRIAAEWRSLAFCGLTAGAAFSLYATALELTEVVRVLLLFYLTPVWGAILGRVWLGERLTARRLAAVGAGLAGLWVVLGADGGLPVPEGPGDWLALAAGLSWSFGSLGLYQDSRAGVADLVVAFMAGAFAATLATIAVAGAALGPLPAAATIAAGVGWGVLAAAYMLPMLVLTIWPATVLTPMRVGLLLMTEVVVGVGSAALLSGEPFGRAEALGTLLILAAAVLEVTARAGGTVRPAG